MHCTIFERKREPQRQKNANFENRHPKNFNTGTMDGRDRKKYSISNKMNIAQSPWFEAPKKIPSQGPYTAKKYYERKNASPFLRKKR